MDCVSGDSIVSGSGGSTASSVLVVTIIEGKHKFCWLDK